MFQPGITISHNWYVWPGTRLVVKLRRPPFAAFAMTVSSVVPLAMALAPERSWNVNACVPLGGTPLTVLTTLALPRCVLVKVQVTVSPAATTNVALRVTRSTELSVSLHTIFVRSNAGVGLLSVE